MSTNSIGADNTLANKDLNINMSTEQKIKSYGFTKTNLIILLISIATIVLGYILMSGGKSDDGVSFDPEVFNTMRISIAPVITTFGYIGILVAIIWRKSSKPEAQKNDKF